MDFLERRLPEEVGIPSTAILSFLDKVESYKFELHSLQIVRKGAIVAEAYAAPFHKNSLHRMQSASKTISGTAMLFAIQERLVNLDDKVVDFFRDNLPDDMDEKFERLTVYHLLTMSSGHDKDTFHEMMLTDNWVKAFFSIPLAYEPGTVWLYNNGIPHILGCIVEKVAMQSVPEFLKPRLIDPLGLEITFGFNEQNEFDSAYSCISLESMLKFTLFYMQRGKWNGYQLLDENLAEMACKALVSNAAGENIPLNSNDPQSGGGYGFQMWHNPCGGFRIAGGGGQIGMVFPDEELAIVCMGFSPDYYAIPGFMDEEIHKKVCDRPLPPDLEANRELQYRLANLSLAPREVSSCSAGVREVDGRRFTFEKNNLDLKAISLHFEENEFQIRAEYENGTTRLIPCGLKARWTEYMGDAIAENDYSAFSVILENEKYPSLLSGGWRNDYLLEVNSRSYASMATGSLLFDFRYNRLKLTVVHARLRGRNPRTKIRVKYAPDVLYGI